MWALLPDWLTGGSPDLGDSAASTHPVSCDCNCLHRCSQSLHILQESSMLLEPRKLLSCKRCAAARTVMASYSCCSREHASFAGPSSSSSPAPIANRRAGDGLSGSSCCRASSRSSAGVPRWGDAAEELLAEPAGLAQSAAEDAVKRSSVANASLLHRPTNWRGDVLSSRALAWPWAIPTQSAGSAERAREAPGALPGPSDGAAASSVGNGGAEDPLLLHERPKEEDAGECA
mmetsp:Transcript_24446/g.77408  ORF Transcript_24446/g.77408 Transcript_24446/m.77408 type:complete len:232 (-) Transcript_24446:138-833(-)